MQRGSSSIAAPCGSSFAGAHRTLSDIFLLRRNELSPYIEPVTCTDLIFIFNSSRCGHRAGPRVYWCTRWRTCCPRLETQRARGHISFLGSGAIKDNFFAELLPNDQTVGCVQNAWSLSKYMKHVQSMYMNTARCVESSSFL